MGLPKAFQAIQLNRASGSSNDETQLHKAQLWELISTADGLSGMIINFTPYTSQYQQIEPPVLLIDGVIQPWAYLHRLTDISTKIQYRDDLRLTRTSSAELYASALELDRQLRVLASHAPKTWWTGNAENIQPDHIVQFLHYCVNMRIHLSFAMRQGPDEKYIHSRLACREACESVAERYRVLPRQLPSGVFFCQALDLQAFTAIFVLLTSYSSRSTDRSSSRIN